MTEARELHPAAVPVFADDHEALFVAKVFQYVADPGFSSTVENYLREQADAYAAVARQNLLRPDLNGDDLAVVAVARAKAEAYADALRVLDNAVEDALDFANQAAKPTEES